MRGRKLLAVAALLLLAPLVVSGQWQRTEVDGDQTCRRETGEIFAVPADSRSWVTFGCNVLNAVEQYLGMSLPAAAQPPPVGNGGGIPADDTAIIPPVWRPFPPLDPYTTGTEHTFDLNPYCYSPSGLSKTIATVGSLAMGLSLASGVLTIADTAAAMSTSPVFSCSDGTNTVVSQALGIEIVSTTLREFGWGASTDTIDESETYSLVYGREDSPFPDVFDEQWTVDLDVTGCGITPIATTLTLEAYPGSGSTLTYGYDYYVLDPPDVAADCQLSAVLSNFVNDTNGANTVIGASVTTFTLDVVAEVAPPGGSVFFTDTTLTPPTLVTPTTYDTKAELATACQATKATGVGYFVAGGSTEAYRIDGGGEIYECTGTSSTDLLLDLSQTSASNVLTYPLWITNYRNVIIRGVHIDAEVQAGNDINDRPGKTCVGTVCTESINRNPRPRIAYGGGLIRLSVFGRVFIEGVHLDLNGQNGDCIIWRSAYNNWSAVTQTQWQANYLDVQNSRCEGREGQAGNHSLHADFVHTQGGGTDYDIPYRMRFENITDISGQEGVVTYPIGGWNTSQYLIRNYSYERVDTWDLPNDDGNSGAPFAASNASYPGALQITNFWYDNNSNYNVAVYRPPLTSLGASNCPTSTGLITVSEIKCGNPPSEFAPADKVGRFYVTPH